MRVLICLYTKESKSQILKAIALSESDILRGDALQEFILQQNTLITREINELLTLTHQEAQHTFVYSNPNHSVSLKYILCPVSYTNPNSAV